MKRSHALSVLAALCTLAGLLLGGLWFMVSLAIGGGLAMNGPWFVALLAALAGAVLAFASGMAERRERRAERERARALRLAVERGQS